MNNTTLSITPEAANFRALGIAFGVTDIVLGTLGNILTIVVFARTLSTSKYGSFNYYIISLAVVDFITAAFVMPFNVAGYVQMQWPFEDAMTSSLLAFAYFTCSCTSLVLLFVITVNHFICVLFTESRTVSISKIRLSLILIFSLIVAPALFIPLLVQSISNPEEPIFGWNNSEFICTFIYEPASWAKYLQVLRIIFQLLPLVLMTTAYAAMFCKLYCSKCLAENSNSTNALPDSDNSYCLISQNEVHITEEEARISREMTSKEKEERELELFKTCIAMSVLFFLLFLPRVVVFRLLDRGSLDVRLRMAASVVAWLSSCVNPIVYVTVNSKFRMEYSLRLKYVKLLLTCRL